MLLMNSFFSSAIVLHVLGKYCSIIYSHFIYIPNSYSVFAHFHFPRALLEIGLVNLKKHNIISQLLFYSMSAYFQMNSIALSCFDCNERKNNFEYICTVHIIRDIESKHAFFVSLQHLVWMSWGTHTLSLASMCSASAVIFGCISVAFFTCSRVTHVKELNIDTYVMKERVSKLTYPTLQHCLRMLYTMNGNSKH